MQGGREGRQRQGDRETGVQEVRGVLISHTVVDCQY